jgi:hypothetical protein
MSPVFVGFLGVSASLRLCVEFGTHGGRSGRRRSFSPGRFRQFLTAKTQRRQDAEGTQFQVSHSPSCIPPRFGDPIAPPNKPFTRSMDSIQPGWEWIKEFRIKELGVDSFWPLIPVSLIPLSPDPAHTQSIQQMPPTGGIGHVVVRRKSVAGVCWVPWRLCASASLR